MVLLGLRFGACVGMVYMLFRCVLGCQDERVGGLQAQRNRELKRLRRRCFFVREIVEVVYADHRGNGFQVARERISDCGRVRTLLKAGGYGTQRLAGERK